MKTPRIAFFDTKSYDREFFEAVNASFKLPIKYFLQHLDPTNVSVTEGFNTVCVFVNDVISKEVVARLAKNGVELIALRSAGYNNVDFEAAWRHKLHVVRVPAYSPHAVAEHAVALMLTLNRKTHKAYFRTRDANFTIQGLLGFDMYGKTAGVVGTGAIGKALIRILKGFGMEVLAYDPKPDRNFSKEFGILYVSFDEILRKSDIISLNCPLTRDTFHMIDAKSIAKMKKGVRIVNTGRGKLIDTKALLSALKTGWVGAAGLDVYEEESEYFFEDFSTKVISDDVLARLLTFSNVLITSHQGFFTKEALTNIARTTLQNVEDYFKGRPLKNEICYRCSEKGCAKLANGRCF